MEPLISVIIPVYNMELYLARCLDSVLNNTYRNLEVICVDDGSKDSSLGILREYEKRDSRIVVIAKENGGVSSARNAGLDRMTGDFLSFVDSDDYLHPQYFELLLKAQQLTGVSIVVAAFERVHGTIEAEKMPHYDLAKSDVSTFQRLEAGKNLKLNSYCGSKLLCQEIIGQTRFTEGISYGEDTIFLLALCERNPSITFGFFNRPVYYYYQGREDSLVHSGRDRYVLAFLSVLSGKASLPETESQYLEPFLKRALDFRYHYKYVQKEKRIAGPIGKMLRRWIPRISSSNACSTRDKFFYVLFILSPRIDRLHLYYRNPNLRAEGKKKRQALHVQQTARIGI